MANMLVTGGADVSSDQVPYDKVCEEGFEDVAGRGLDIRRVAALTGHEPRVTLDESVACTRDWGRG